MSSIKDVIRNNLISIQKLNQEVEVLKSNNEVEVLKQNISNLENKVSELDSLVEIIKCKCNINCCSKEETVEAPKEEAVEPPKEETVEENIQLSVN